MSHMAITDADRGPDGRILVNQDAERSLSDLLPAAAAETEQERPPAKPWRPGKMELAGAVGGLLLSVILIAAINTFWPAPAPRVVPRATATTVPLPTPAPTAAPIVPVQNAYSEPAGIILGTIPATATIQYRHSGWPGWGGIIWQGNIVWIETRSDLTGMVDLAPPPTPRPIPTAAPQAAPAAAPPPVDAPCDPEANPRYTAPLLVDPIGSVVGTSCTSQAEADANAMQLAEAMRATAEAPGPAPTPSAR